MGQKKRKRIIKMWLCCSYSSFMLCCWTNQQWRGLLMPLSTWILVVITHLSGQVFLFGSWDANLLQRTPPEFKPGSISVSLPFLSLHPGPLLPKQSKAKGWFEQQAFMSDIIPATRGYNVPTVCLWLGQGTSGCSRSSQTEAKLPREPRRN